MSYMHTHLYVLTVCNFNVVSSSVIKAIVEVVTRISVVIVCKIHENSTADICEVTITTRSGINRSGKNKLPSLCMTYNASRYCFIKMCIIY